MFKKNRKLDTLKHNHKKQLLNASLVLLLLIILNIKYNSYIKNKIEFDFHINNSSNLDYKTDNKDIVFDSKSFEDLSIIGKSYIVYDVENDKIIASKNENSILPLASLTKVISAITMLKLSSSTREIVIKKSLMGKDEVYDPGLYENQKWQMDQLLKFALVYSSNASMDIIANTISNKNSKREFIDEMNSYVKGLGYKDFYFNSPSGLDYGQEIGGRGTALEYAKLFAKSYDLIPDILSYTTNSKINIETNNNKIYSIPNTNREASNFVGLLSSKTGYTDAAGGNLAVMFNLGIGRRIVIVVLGSTVYGRFKDVDTLYNATKYNLVNR